MRFKIYFDEKEKELKVSCLSGNTENMVKHYESHVLYQTPDILFHTFSERLKKLMKKSHYQNEYKSIQDQINQLIEARRELVENARKELYPEMIKECDKVKLETAEYFI